MAKYEVSVHGAARVMVAPSPKPLFPRAMLHTSVLAWLAVQNFALGVPNYRLERHVSAMGESLDRSTMCRNLEGLGSTLGATIVHALPRDAIETCSVDRRHGRRHPAGRPRRWPQARLQEGHLLNHLHAFALSFVPSIAMCPSLTRPAFWQSRKTCKNMPASASRCCLRNDAIESWSGCWSPASTRNPVSSQVARSVRRDDGLPTQDEAARLEPGPCSLDRLE
ncbi:MAG: transposase [Myxococcales bacterium]|nr:transposase [Myxococcales bacterium]